MANFIKPFWHNLCNYEHIALGFDLGYATRGINNTKKGFMKLPPGIKIIKLFELIWVSLRVYPIVEESQIEPHLGRLLPYL